MKSGTPGTVAHVDDALHEAHHATLKRRLISLVYEALILAAILLAGTLPVVLITRTWEPAVARITLQLFLVILCGCFYVWQWTGTGQTLPMKTWKLQLVSNEGLPVTCAHALLRYAGALASVSTMGLGFLWAALDRDQQFLHDRLAGTKLVMRSG